jgi:hypothetical protein
VHVEDQGVRQASPLAIARVGAARLAIRRHAAGDDGQRQQERRRRLPAMPPNELSRAIGPGVALRLDRPTVEVAVNILSELLHRRVAPLRLLAQRREEHCVEIAAQRAMERLSVAGTMLSATARLGGTGGTSVTVRSISAYVLL